jgi:chromatin remodeling complex protein RSC6
MSQSTKQTKTVKPSAAAVATPAAAAPVVVAAVVPAKAKPTKAKADVAAASTAAPAVVAAAAPAVAAAKAKVVKVEAPSTVVQTEGTATEVPAVDVVTSHEELETLANDMIKMAKRFLELSRTARKDFAKQVKKAEQGGKKRRVKADGESTHSNSVFLQPAKISSELAVFCGVEPGTMLSRTDCTRKIAAYIKEHDLQNPDNRREILSDATLIKLFALTSEDKLNYFNLQRYIKPHFIKEIKVVA